MGKFEPKDYTGQRFSKLVAISNLGRRPSSTGRSSDTWWLYQCDCGNRVEVRAGHVTSGRQVSCGCYRPEPWNRTHGKTRTPEYTIWQCMKARCLNPNNQDFGRYGGRGISICDRWLSGEAGQSGSECFLIDMGERPTSRHQIDRIDFDGDYKPDNCRWVLPVVQNRNRSVTAKDGDKTVKEISEQTGIPYGTLMNRWRSGDRGAVLLRPRRMTKQQFHAETGDHEAAAVILRGDA